MKLHLRSALIIVATAQLICACSANPLKVFKQAAAKNQWQTIATTDFACKASEKSCDQLHLLKGDACYRLAKQNTESAKNYLCAAEHLEQGIRLTSDWSIAEPIVGDRAQYYENWCESLRMLRSEQTNTADATTYNQKLLSCAQAFLKAPGQLQAAATFFLHNAELAAIRFKLNAADYCPALRQLLHDETVASRQAEQSRYVEQHRHLLNDITGIKASLPGCH